MVRRSCGVPAHRLTICLGVTSAVARTYGCGNGRIEPTRCAVIDAGHGDRCSQGRGCKTPPPLRSNGTDMRCSTYRFICRVQEYVEYAAYRRGLLRIDVVGEFMSPFCLRQRERQEIGSAGRCSTMRHQHLPCLLIGRNAWSKALIVQAAIPPVVETLFDPSCVIRQQNQWVRGGRYGQWGFHRSLSSVCSWRSTEGHREGRPAQRVPHTR